MILAGLPKNAHRASFRRLIVCVLGQVSRVRNVVSFPFKLQSFPQRPHDLTTSFKMFAPSGAEGMCVDENLSSVKRTRSDEHGDGNDNQGKRAMIEVKVSSSSSSRRASSSRRTTIASSSNGSNDKSPVSWFFRRAFDAINNGNKYSQKTLLMAINNQIGNGDYPAALELLRRLCNRYDTEKDKVVRLRPEWFVERLGYMTSKHFNTKSTDDGYPRSVAKEYLMPTLVAKPDYMVLPRTLLELSLLCDNGKGCMILLSFLLLLGAHFDVHDAVAHSHLDKGLITQLSEYVKPALVRAKSFLGGDYSSAEWGNTTLGEAVIQLCLKSDAPSSLKQKFLDGATLAFRGIPMVPSSKCFVEPRFLRDREEKGKSAASRRPCWRDTISTATTSGIRRQMTEWT